MTPRAIVSDIEGTTTSLAFVKDQLFPFAKAHLAEFVANNIQSPLVRLALQQTRELAEQPTLSDAAVVALLGQWIDQDRKVTPLKNLQGLIWAEGYDAGRLKGQVYPDAAIAFRAWKERGIDLYIYSSGSITAQKLLFGHSDQGDLTPLLSGYFDTTTGSKLLAASYLAIADAIGLPPGEILFLSDNIFELDAARIAGLATAALNRGEAPLPANHPHPEFSSFADLDPFSLIG